MNNKVIDERQNTLTMLVSRNAFITSLIYLLGALIYNLFVLDDVYLGGYIINYFVMIVILLLIAYVGVTQKNEMKFLINFKYLKSDEMERTRFNNVLGVTGILLIFASIIFLFIKVYMKMPDTYLNLDMYLIGVYGITMIISSLYYKDIRLPKNIKDLDEFYSNRFVRIKMYAKEAFFSMLGWTAVGTLIFDENIIEFTSMSYVNMFISMLMRFLVFFVLDFIFGELNVKRALDIEKEIDDEY